MDISVAICTWNNAELLRQTLEKMKRLQVPDGVSWALIVVNNNCTDSTDSVVDEFSERLPIIKVLERRQGLSHARNAAMEHASSEWLIFTDDDVLVSDQWLTAYWDAIREVSRLEQRVGFLGGEVRPWFPVPPSQELAAAIPTVASGFCGREIPIETTIVSGDDLPLGANFAIRFSAASKTRFNPNLGVRGARRIAGEETEFLESLLNSGWLGRWVPLASVQHFVDPRRLTLNYLMRHLFDLGRTHVRGARQSGGKWLPQSWMYRETVESLPRMLAYSIRGQKRAFYEQFKLFFLRSGSLFEYWCGSRPN